MIKIIYIEQRRAGDSREYWARRWRMHGGFAMQFREFWDPVRIYVQNDCVADCSAFAGADPGFGGVGELHYTDLASCQASLATPNMPAIMADGNQVFARQKAVHLVTEAQDLIGTRPAAVRVFAYASRPDGLDQSTFRARLDESFAASAKAFPVPPVHMSIAHNIEPCGTHESVMDFSFHTMDEAAAGHEAWAAAAAQDPFLAGALARDPLKVVTHSCILYDTDHFGEG
ncbi:MAG: hypothetical protein H6915_06990 [Novosphingobium sp.]|nr:hypothetical protein [Novosphingobium sp.]MCP5380031.1 hypothetical protein [Novosphingobium sp.]MCP5389497.1 hypothetical protein [Novosphingobium sp.]